MPTTALTIGAMVVGGLCPCTCGGTVSIGPSGDSGSGNQAASTTTSMGGNGGGATTSGSTSSSTTSTTSSDSTTSTSSTASPCDHSGSCYDCAECGVEAVCSGYVQICEANAECVDLMNCMEGCATEGCFDACYAAYPDGLDDYFELETCLVCDACQVDCDVHGCP